MLIILQRTSVIVTVVTVTIFFGPKKDLLALKII